MGLGGKMDKEKKFDFLHRYVQGEKLEYAALCPFCKYVNAKHVSGMIKLKADERHTMLTGQKYSYHCSWDDDNCSVGKIFGELFSMKDMPVVHIVNSDEE